MRRLVVTVCRYDRLLNTVSCKMNSRVLTGSMFVALVAIHEHGISIHVVYGIHRGNERDRWVR